MNFEDITAVLTPFFQEKKFSIAESFKDYIRYEYKSVNIAVAYDWRDRFFSVFIEQGGKLVAELSDGTIGEFFNDDIKLRNDGHFTEDFFKFFNGKGSTLLKADLNTLSRLKEFSNRKAKEYTDNLIIEQHLRSADDAWNRKSYSEFVSQLNKIAKDSLPKTYLMKYQYAWKKINQ